MKPRLIGYFEAALGQVVASMTGGHFKVAVEESATDAPQLDGAITWQQAFSVLEGPSFWMAAGKDLWEAIGRQTLEAAGIDEVTDDDCRSTWQEILNQTVAALAAALTAEAGYEVTVTAGAETDSDPAGVEWLAFSIEGGAGRWLFRAAWTRELAAISEPRREETGAAPVKDSPVSKTFDLLLEVALPIAVSFGKTSLQIREVLKLNTGSIVELDRFVTDPVEVIVNDCVIARGEVVVVDGNYGVRINQLASREERLRSGMVEHVHKGGRG